MKTLVNITTTDEGAELNVNLDGSCIVICIKFEISNDVDPVPIDSAWMETMFGAEAFAEAKRVCFFLREILTEKGLAFLKSIQETNAELIDLLQMYHAKEITEEVKDEIRLNALHKALCLKNITRFDWE